MQKTKLGISVGLLGAAVYFAAFFGGYVPVILITGYILVAEENVWLKKTGIKAVALLMAIEVLLKIIGLVPDLLSWIGSVVRVFDGTLDYGMVSSVFSVVIGAIGIIRTIVCLLLGIGAISQTIVRIPVVDNMIDKYM